MRILVLSAYDAESHRYWHTGLVAAFPEHQWCVLSLPARYFSWRVRGNSLSWSRLEREKLNKGYDLLLVTSMVDLASLRGFIPRLAQLPTLVYFHENQFAYPLSDRQDSRSLLDPQMVSLYTALCGDRILFNSAYNRHTFLNGCETLLRKLPDFVPPDIMPVLRESGVLPVPIKELAGSPRLRRKSELLWLVWNHRWEYDKGPERLLLLVRYLIEADCCCQLSVLGPRFRQIPEAFDELQCLLASQDVIVLKHWGYLASRQAYFKVLADADVVISTALHDFQGIAVQEAIAQGCSPLLPDRLVYPEYVSTDCLYPSWPELPEREVRGLFEGIKERVALKRKSKALPQVDLSDLSWSSQRCRWQQVFMELASQK